jgi:hypothetical protein
VEDQESSDAWIRCREESGARSPRQDRHRCPDAGALGLCFFYSPALLTWWLRATMSTIETVAGLFPYPWGDRVEIAMRALGGSFWFLITSAIVMVRVVFWLIAAGWRHRPSGHVTSVSCSSA